MPQPLFAPLSSLASVKVFRHHRAHAFLGAYAFSHFFYRNYAFLNDEPDMGFTESITVPLLFIPHVLLQVSGFGFEIPRKRHPEGNRIWPEYRWHALVFFLRSLFLIMLAWLRKRKSSGIPSCWNAMVVLLTMLSSDAVTRFYIQRDESSSTIRGLNAPRGLQYLMSSAQFHATVHCLLTFDHLTVQLAAMMVVQTTSFGMTLRRKGWIDLPKGLVLYSFVLALGMLAIWKDFQQQGLIHSASTVANVAAMARMDLVLNKYVLWTLVAACLYYGIDALLIDESTWVVLARVSSAMLVVSAIARSCLTTPTSKDAKVS